MKNRILYIIILSTCLIGISCQGKSAKSKTKSQSDEILKKDEITPSVKSEAIPDNNDAKENHTSKEIIETESSEIDAEIESEPQKTEETPAKKIITETATAIDKSTNKAAEIVKSNSSATTNNTTVSENKVITSQTTTETKNVIDKVSTEIKPVNNPQNTETEKITKPEKPAKVIVPVDYPNHKLFDSFLKNYVSNQGKVNYASMKKKEADLDEYLTTLENTKFNTTWTRNDKLTFWINAYNAYTIKLILNNYPLGKITDLYNGKPWDHKWIKLNGKTLSLNNIENDIIRPEFNDPRIHFAVNCAAKSCPPLLNAAYSSPNLESQLESQTKKFINNQAHNILSKSEITVSKIFDWYGTDFGDIATYIARYADTTVKSNAKVKFNEYDWSLNGM